MKPLALSPDRSITAQLYDHLRQEIVENRLSPLARLSEAGLCDHYAVSRQPIREVLLRLAGDRLVTVHPKRGTFVTPVSATLFHAAQLIREAVEVEVAARVAATASPALRHALDQEIARQSDCLATGDTAGFYASDETFHALIAGASGISALWPSLRDHKVHLDRVRYISLADGQDAGPLIRDHSDIRDAIASRDPDAARAAMRAHLRRVLARIAPLARAHPDWFTD